MTACGGLADGRTEILDRMGELKLFGMRGAFDEVIANGVKRRHEPRRIIGDWLKAEVAEKAARSIKYRLAIAKLLAKDLSDFAFKGTPINEARVTLPPAAASLGSAMSCRPAEPLAARPILPSRSLAVASAAAHAAGSSTSSIRSIGSRPRAATAGDAELPIA
jgi:hypothetical protein